MEHTFVVESLSTNVWCNHCLKFMWGRKHLCCAECGFVAHRKCAPLAAKTCARGRKPRRQLRTMHDVENLDDVERAIRQPGSGLAVMDRRVLFQTYRQCFVGKLRFVCFVPLLLSLKIFFTLFSIGRELVDWIIVNMPVRTRSESVAIAQRLLDLGHIAHTKGSSTFKDEDHAYYSFPHDCPEPSDSESSDEQADESSSMSSARSSSHEPRNAQTDTETDNTQVSVSDFELLKVVGKGGYDLRAVRLLYRYAKSSRL